MNELIPWVFGAAAVVSAAIWGVGGAVSVYRRLTGEPARARRLFARTPPCPIGSVTDGDRVKIVGKVVLVEPIESGLTGETAACAVVVVDQPMGGLTVLRDVRASSFVVVEDETGRAHVRLKGAELDLQPKTTLFSGGIDDPKPTPAMIALLDAHGRSPDDYLRLRYTEARLTAGQQVWVYGLARCEVDREADAGYRSARTRVVLASRGGTKLLVTDRPTRGS